MTLSHDNVKGAFGLIIFSFSLALAYFTASYVESASVFDYWGALLLMSAVYLIVGIAVYQVYAISLGFLFSADIMVIHLMSENFGDLDSPIKMFVVGGVLLVMYGFAWQFLKDEPLPPMQQPPTPPVTPAMPPAAQTSLPGITPAV